MATNSVDRILPALPNELLIMIIHSFRWTDNLDQLRFLWEKLQLVSPMFEEIVKKIFARSNLSNPRELLSLLPRAKLFLEDHGKFSFDFTLFPRQIMWKVNFAVDEMPVELWSSPSDIYASFDRLLADGTAVFRFKKSVDSETSTEFLEESFWGLHFSMGGCRFDVTKIAVWDPVGEEFLISWKELYSAYDEEMKIVKELQNWAGVTNTGSPQKELDLNLEELIVEIRKEWHLE